MVITFTVAGDVSDVDQDRQKSILAGLQEHFSCYPPDCYAVLRVTAASVSLALEMLVPTDAPAVIASAVIAQAQAAASEPLADLSATVGATVEKSPEVAVRGRRPRSPRRSGSATLPSAAVWSIPHVV